MTYRKRQQVTGILFLLPYAVMFGLFLLLPIGVALYLSVMQFDLTAKDQISFVGTKNYADAWADGYFAQAFMATLNFVILMVPSLMVTALTIAVGLNSAKRGMTWFRGMIFLPGMFTISIAAIMWQWFYNLEFGFFNYVLRQMGFEAVHWLSEKQNAMPSIVLMSLWWIAGGNAVILLAALQQVPKMYLEAASLDGANNWFSFWRVTIPIIRPVLLFSLLTNTIGAFQMFPQASLLTGGGPELATRGVVQYIYETAFNNYRLGYAASMSWMLTAVILVFGFVQFVAMRRNAHQ